MKGLSGDFATMSVKELIGFLGNKRASGALNLERAGVRKQVTLREGAVVNASSNQPREYLGQFLINMGHLSEEQFMKAFETQKETNIFLGRILTMIGLVSEEVVRNALALKFRETLLEAFNWGDGIFAFDGAGAGENLQGLELSVDLLDIAREGEFRETAWQAIRAVFPDGNARLELHENKLTERPKPGSLDERLFAQIREGQTIDDMILALHATDFFVYQRLYALYRQEMVRISEDLPAVDVVEDEPLGNDMELTPTSGEIVRHARSFLDQGNFREAEQLARRAFEMSPSNDNAELLRKAEAGLAQQLKTDFMLKRRIPTLQVSPSKLRSLDLSAPEKYLLSRIDSRRDIASIVQVSPLQQLEALKLFARFVESGLIKLAP